MCVESSQRREQHPSVLTREQLVSMGDSVPSGRPKLNLKPRDPAAAAEAELKRSQTGKAVRHLLFPAFTA